MNKKANTVIFVLVGTLVNILITLIIIVGLLVVSALIFQNHPQVFSLLSVVIVFGGLFGTMVIYQKLSTWVIEKFKLEDKLEPLWGSHNKKKPY